MTDAGGPSAKFWLAFGLGLGVIVLATVLGTVAMFAKRRRDLRLANAFGGHPAGTGAGIGRGPLVRSAPPTLAPPPSGPAVDLPPPPVGGAHLRPRPALAPPPAGPTRFRRREPVPPIRVAEPSDEVRLTEIDGHTTERGITRSGLGALPAPALRDAPTRASVVLVAGRPALGYVRVDELDLGAHVDRLCVLPTAVRRGIGKALLQAAIDWAGQHHYRTMTLSTFADAEWTTPVFEAVGFRPTGDLTAGLVELRDWEQALGLTAFGARVIMRRDL